MQIVFQSFGYKHGAPIESNFMFDVRCLTNPFWNEALRDYTGRDEKVIEFLHKQTAVQNLLNELRRFLSCSVGLFEESEVNSIKVAIGCTGGQHRSVYMVEQLAKYFRQQEKQVIVEHRDLS